MNGNEESAAAPDGGAVTGLGAWVDATASQESDRPSLSTGADGRVTEQELVEAVQSSRSVVIRTLATGWQDDVDDVLQTTWIDAAAALDRFDSERGSLQTWVRTIARRRAVDHARARQREQEGQHVLEVAAQAREQSAVTLWQDDAEIDDLLAAQQAVEQGGPLLRAAQRVLPNPETFQRAVETIIGCGNDISLASRRMGVSADALRAARREFVATCQVVAAAQAARNAGRPATVATVLDCVAESEPDEAGSWRGEVAAAMAAVGVPVGEVTAGMVAERTGFSFHTSRQYLAKMQFWLSVAATVMQTPGEAGDETDADEDRWW